jgi:hypothetical protein
MNERDHHRMEASLKAGEMIAANLAAILEHWDAENVRVLARHLYTLVDCGPSLSVRLHDGTWRHTGDLEGIDNGNVRALRVSSIVEGSEAVVAADPFDLLLDAPLEEVVASFNEVVDGVNHQASILWEESNA